MYYFISFTLVVILSKVPQKFIWNSNMFFLFLSFCRSILLLLSWLLCSFLFFSLYFLLHLLLSFFFSLVWFEVWHVLFRLSSWIRNGSHVGHKGQIWATFASSINVVCVVGQIPEGTCVSQPSKERKKTFRTKTHPREPAFVHRTQKFHSRLTRMTVNSIQRRREQRKVRTPVIHPVLHV